MSSSCFFGHISSWLLPFPCLNSWRLTPSFHHFLSASFSPSFVKFPLTKFISLVSITFCEFSTLGLRKDRCYKFLKKRQFDDHQNIGGCSIDPYLARCGNYQGLLLSAKKRSVCEPEKTQCFNREKPLVLPQHYRYSLQLKHQWKQNHL